MINLNPKESGTVVKITEEKQEVLEYLATLGLMPGASVEVVEKAPFNGPITVKVEGTNRALSREVAAIINVKKPNERG